MTIDAAMDWRERSVVFFISAPAGSGGRGSYYNRECLDERGRSRVYSRVVSRTAHSGDALDRVRAPEPSRIRFQLANVRVTIISRGMLRPPSHLTASVFACKLRTRSRAAGTLRTGALSTEEMSTCGVGRCAFSSVCVA